MDDHDLHRRHALRLTRKARRELRLDRQYDAAHALSAIICDLQHGGDVESLTLQAELVILCAAAGTPWLAVPR